MKKIKQAVKPSAAKRNAPCHKFFPGGLKEDGDKDVTETALREMNEEIGVNPKDVDVWGKLIPLPNRTGDALATGVVAFIKNVDASKLNEQCNKKEVELVFTVPISELCDPTNNSYTRFDPPKSTKKGPYTMPVFKGSGFHIWGLTALFTDMTLRALLPKYMCTKSIYL
ncbi:nucleoside diphosphate-linked moiety X motif 8-like [Asterias rubens]|uniref:nucleoside diphosphate-linked moiety X motif 8-like n=1 Tax=Asterias rubens TaxID=7604 RepID=UPI001455CE01|nr:nucleoside diphosphate-linked moiety X motif 8-like [Asterias rubens]